MYAVYKLLNVSELVDMLVGVWMASRKGKWLIIREICPTAKMRISRERGWRYQKELKVTESLIKRGLGERIKPKGQFSFEFYSKCLEFDFNSLLLHQTSEIYFRVYLLSSFYIRQGSLGRGPC